jgi:hypothetical protein
MIDAAQVLLGPDDARLYVEDTYGGHYSAEGNEVIARLIARHAAPLLQSVDAASKRRRSTCLTCPLSLDPSLYEGVLDEQRTEPASRCPTD